VRAAVSASKIWKDLPRLISFPLFPPFFFSTSQPTLHKVKKYEYVLHKQAPTPTEDDDFGRLLAIGEEATALRLFVGTGLTSTIEGGVFTAYAAPIPP
jgi:hypothetical protein